MKRKRNGWDVAWAYAWTFATIVWIVVGTYLLVTQPFEIAGCLLWMLVMLVPGTGMLCMIKYEHHVKTLEFILYEFELWSKESNDYEKRWIIIDKTLRAKFVYHVHVSDYECVMSQEEVEEYIDGMKDSIMGWEGYSSKEAAMKEIIDRVKSYVKSSKEAEGIRIRNVRAAESFTVEELKQRLAAGEFKDEKK